MYNLTWSANDEIGLKDNKYFPDYIHVLSSFQVHCAQETGISCRWVHPVAFPQDTFHKILSKSHTYHIYLDHITPHFKQAEIQTRLYAPIWSGVWTDILGAKHFKKCFVASRKLP